MPTENINIETQVQVDITRAALQALIAANTVKKKLYHVTDAIGGTQKILVWSLTNSTTSFNAVNFTNGKFGKYYIGPDVFVAIVEGMGGVLSYNSFAVFPTTGLQNTVYIDLATNEQYYWNGSSYELLSGGNVYEPTVDDFPTIGSADTLYVATETGVMYLWDTTDEVYVALSDNGNYIPLAGTNVGNPVTGNIEVVGGNIFYNDGFYYNYFSPDAGGDVGFVNNDLVGNTDVTLLASSGQSLINSSSFAGYRGIEYAADYSANFVDLSLINLAVMKSRIWTKAGTPDVNDDSTKGFVFNSLIWDTTNSILYKCTDNTAGAAAWTKAIKSKSYLGGRNVTSMASSAATYIPIYQLSGATNLNLPNDLTNFDPRSMVMDVDTTFLSITAATGGSQPASGSFQIILVVDGVDSSLVLTIPAGSAIGHYSITGSVVVPAGSRVAYKYKNNATAQGCVISIVKSLIEI